MRWTEAQVIELISEIFETRKDISPKGIGDDCAVIDLSCADKGYALITTDASVENIHFNLEWMTLADAAYRCMTSNISDIAAMGGYAGAFTLALGLKAQHELDEIREAIYAIKTCIQEHSLDKCWLIGGDVVRSEHTFFSITLLASKPAWPLIYRNGAEPGDCILVVGNIGMSAAGLEILASKCDLDKNNAIFQPFTQAFKRPRACTQLGPAIAQKQLATAMMDISDGIHTDLTRLLNQSQCAAQIDLESFKPSPDMISVAEILHANPIDWMTCGGEDFGLLMTCKEKNVRMIEALARECNLPCIIIGKCIPGNGISWRLFGKTVEKINTGFVHF